jgi:uncharacterized protein YfaQ (DUF2300 family)
MTVRAFCHAVWLGIAMAMSASCVQAAAPRVAQTKAQAEPGEHELQLAWLDHDRQLHTAVLDEQGAVVASPSRPVVLDAVVPLGSLWKLVAYARLAESGQIEAPYTCRGQNKDEVYCCEPGQRIERARALWRSCGLYFEPARIGWTRLPEGDTLRALPESLRALHDSAAMGSRTPVPLAAWLQWLADWSPMTQQAARDDLLAYWLEGPGRATLGQVGSRLRVKTFTVERAERGGEGQRWAGASGWTSDGRPVWLAARGSSRDVLPRWAALVLSHLDQVDQRAGEPLSSDASCVDVRFFARYPLASIQSTDARQQGAAVQAGPLKPGAYRVRFDNGVTLDLASRGELRWQVPADGPPTLTGRFKLDDYVARVIEREGSGQPAAAARALAIAARTYVTSHGASKGGCLAIDDSSRQQRVAPRPPSRDAVAAANATADLVLRGSDGRYHASQASPGVMAWQDIVKQGEQGLLFDAMLARAYPKASLAARVGEASTDCEPLPLAQDWLFERSRQWAKALRGEPGFSAPERVRVCRLQQGLPHALRVSQRIHVRGFQSLDDRITLTHEYLHLAFSGHPSGTDEAFIERRARRLLGVD